MQPTQTRSSRIVALASHQHRKRRGMTHNISKLLPFAEKVSGKFISSVSAEVLNDWSLQSFLGCGIEACVAIALVSAQEPLLFTLIISLFGRVCLGIISVIHLIVLAPELCGAVRRSEFDNMHLKRAVISLCTALTGVASWPGMLYITPIIVSPKETVIAVRSVFSNEVLGSYAASMAIEAGAIVLYPALCVLMQWPDRQQQSVGTAAKQGVRVSLSIVVNRGPTIFISSLWLALWLCTKSGSLCTALTSVLNVSLLLPGALAVVGSLASAIAAYAVSRRRRLSELRMKRLRELYAAFEASTRAKEMVFAAITAKWSIYKAELYLDLVLAGVAAVFGGLFLVVAATLRTMLAAATSPEGALFASGVPVEFLDMMDARHSQVWVVINVTWIGIKVAALLGLVFISRALQAAWDAEDDYEEVWGDQTKLVDTDETITECHDHILKHLAVPATLERISDGRYCRTSEDVQARTAGLQIYTNPLHEVKNVQDALARRAQRYVTAVEGLCHKCKRGSLPKAVLGSGANVLAALSPGGFTARRPVSSAGAQACQAGGGTENRCRRCNRTLQGQRNGLLFATTAEIGSAAGAKGATGPSISSKDSAILTATVPEHLLDDTGPTLAQHMITNPMHAPTGPAGQTFASSAAAAAIDVDIKSQTGRTGDPPRASRETASAEPTARASRLDSPTASVDLEARKRSDDMPSLAAASPAVLPRLPLWNGPKLALHALEAAPWSARGSAASPVSARGSRTLALGSPQSVRAIAETALGLAAAKSSRHHRLSQIDDDDSTKEGSQRNITAPRETMERVRDGCAGVRGERAAAAGVPGAAARASAVAGSKPDAVISPDSARSSQDTLTPRCAIEETLLRYKSKLQSPRSAQENTPRTGPEREACVICFEKPGDAVFMECGHGNVCQGCAKVVLMGLSGSDGDDNSNRTGQCPMCRAPVTQVLRLGADTLSTDGRIVAQVLPGHLWSCLDA